MKISIGQRIWLGFGSLILLTLIVLYLTNKAVAKSKEIYTVINESYTPTGEALEVLNYKLEQSKILINYWAYVESKSGSPEKQNCLRIIEEDIPTLQSRLDTLSSSWDMSGKERKAMVYRNIEELFQLYSEVMIYLPDFESYQGNSGFNWFMSRDLTEEGGVIYEKVTDIRFNLKNLILDNKKRENEALQEMIGSFEKLQFYSTYIGGFLMLFGLFIGLITARSIVRPVNSLKEKLVSMSRGVLPDMQQNLSLDEIGEMSVALNNLIQGQQRIKDFVNALGSGDFTSPYDPLSSDDELAPDFIKTRDALAENERITEQKIRERTQELELKNKQINEQSKKVTELYQDLRDSIEYAKRLQDSILPTEEMIHEAFPDSFLHFKPKDIVSGDFYWTAKIDNMSYVAAVDCTGHGVPGAFMSLVGHNSIKMAMKDAEIQDSASIMKRINYNATRGLNRVQKDGAVRDGMDASLVVYDNDSKILKYTGALRPFYYVRDGELTKVRGDRSAIGSPGNEEFEFNTETIQMKSGDIFYIFSDGYPDQFGGESEAGTKFKMRRFNEMLLNMNSQSMDTQKSIVQHTMMNWQGRHAQIDDILLFGCRIP